MTLRTFLAEYRQELAGLAFGAAIALAVFGLAEAIHHAGLNPFASPAAVADSLPPELATDGADQGGQG
jgi:uncharacterized membrane protein YidH (DUF202 family)